MKKQVFAVEIEQIGGEGDDRWLELYDSLPKANHRAVEQADAIRSKLEAQYSTIQDEWTEHRREVDGMRYVEIEKHGDCVWHVAVRKLEVR